MITAKVQIKHTSAETLFCHPLPKGASGLKVAFEFTDPFWNTLSKTAVFRNYDKTIDAIVTDDCAIIPHELLTEV